MAKFRVNPLSVLWHFIRNDIHKLQYDPITQFEFNRRMAFFWLCNFVFVLGLDFFLNPTWQRISILYLALVSIYANFVGHYSALPGGHAAIKGDEIKAQQDKTINNIPTSAKQTPSKFEH